MSDLIERKDAIDAIYHHLPSVSMDWAKMIMNEVTSACSEVRWIPVTERLPDDLEEVNITWVNHEPESYYSSIKDKPFTAPAVFYKGRWYWWTQYTQDLLGEYGERYNLDELDAAIEVTAWQPLPDPWEVEND